jgi:hypothetical protein
MEMSYDHPDRERPYLVAVLIERLSWIFGEAFVYDILHFLGGRFHGRLNLIWQPAPLRLQQVGRFLKIVSRPIMADHTIDRIG